MFVLLFFVVHEQQKLKWNEMAWIHTYTDDVFLRSMCIFIMNTRVCVQFKDDISSLCCVHNEIEECIQNLNKEQIEKIKWANPRIIFLFLSCSSLLFGIFILILLFWVSLNNILFLLIFFYHPTVIRWLHVCVCTV